MENKENALEIMRSMNRLNEALWLVVREVPFGIPGKLGVQLIHQAASGGHHELLRELLSRGADPLVRDYQGRDALTHISAGFAQALALESGRAGQMSTPPDWTADHVGCVRSIWLHLLAGGSELRTESAAPLFRALLNDDETAFSVARVAWSAVLRTLREILPSARPR